MGMCELAHTQIGFLWNAGGRHPVRYSPDSQPFRDQERARQPVVGAKRTSTSDQDRSARSKMTRRRKRRQLMMLIPARSALIGGGHACSALPQSRWGGLVLTRVPCEQPRRRMCSFAHADFVIGVRAAPRTRSARPSESAGSASPRQATCWSGRTSTSLWR
jgi:hypothetical protein